MIILGFQQRAARRDWGAGQTSLPTVTSMGIVLLDFYQSADLSVADLFGSRDPDKSTRS
jgi:hypothetical protein